MIREAAPRDKLRVGDECYVVKSRRGTTDGEPEYLAFSGPPVVNGRETTGRGYLGVVDEGDAVARRWTGLGIFRVLREAESYPGYPLLVVERIDSETTP